MEENRVSRNGTMQVPKQFNEEREIFPNGSGTPYGKISQRLDIPYIKTDLRYNIEIMEKVKLLKETYKNIVKAWSR